MSAAQILYAESASDVTASSTTYVDVATISAASFTANKRYLILATALVGCNNATDDLKVRLVHGATPTVFTDAGGDYEVTANQQKVCAGFLYWFTQPSTTEDVKLQIANIASSTTTCILGQIYAIKLDDDFTENTDYFINEVTADYTTTTSFTAQASVTFTPNGTDRWLVLGHAAIQPGSVTTPYRMSLHDSVEGLDEPSLEHEGEDITNELRQHLIMRAYTPSAASHTFSVRFNHTTTAATVKSSRIIAINLSKFAQNAIAYTAAEDQPSASPTWETEQTVSITPTATGDFMILAYYTNDIGTSGDVVNTRLQINNGGGLASDPNYGDDGPNLDGHDSSDQTPMMIGKVRSLSSGGSRTINLDCTMISGTGLRVQERCIVVFSAELATTTQTITPSGLATAEAFGSAALALYVAPAGLATAEAFGDHQLALYLAPAGVATAEAFGAHQLDLALLMAAIGSAEAFGDHQLALYVAPAGLATAEAFGAPVLVLYVAPAGLDTAEAFGAPVLVLYVAPAGLATAEAFGAAVVAVDGSLTLLPAGVATAEAFGAHQLDLALLMAAIGSAEAFGDHQLALYLAPAGVATAEAFGAHQLDLALLMAAIGSAEAFGAALLAVDGALTLYPAGVATAEAFGSTIVLVYLTPDGRVVIVPADARAELVPADGRTISVLYEDRVNPVIE